MILNFSKANANVFSKEPATKLQLFLFMTPGWPIIVVECNRENNSICKLLKISPTEEIFFGHLAPKEFNLPL